MTKIEIHSFWLQIDKWWKWASFGQNWSYSAGSLLKSPPNWNSFDVNYRMKVNEKEERLADIEEK